MVESLARGTRQSIVQLAEALRKLDRLLNVSEALLAEFSTTGPLATTEAMNMSG